MARRTGSFQVHPYLQKRWTEVGRKSVFACENREQWRRWRSTTVRTLKKLTGYDTMSAVEPAPRITETIEFKDYVRQRVEIQTEPGVVMPMYVLAPRHRTLPFVPVIAAHGHESAGKQATAGCRDIPAVAKTIDQYNYDYGVQLVRAGFIAFCPDARGFGERQEEAAKEDVLNASCQWINHMALPLGQTVTGMWAWDLHRLVDYVQSRDDCVADRIGCAGLSGGGHQTLWAAALDTRITCAVISGYLYGYKQALLDLHTNCSCNYVPHVWEHVDMGDIAALIAPRPLLVESGTRDPLNGAGGLRNVRSQMRTVRKAYRLLDSGSKLKHDVFDGEHVWHGVEAIPWLKRHLTSDQ